MQRLFQILNKHYIRENVREGFNRHNYFENESEMAAISKTSVCSISKYRVMIHVDTHFDQKVILVDML